MNPGTKNRKSALWYNTSVDANITIGCVVIAAALAFSTFIVLWSKRTISRIARRGDRPTREIEKELNGKG